MRTFISAATLIAMAAFAPAAVAAEPPICQPNPLTHSHPAWVKLPTAAADLRTPPPASATNPLMQDFERAPTAPGSAIESGAPQVDPLIHQP